ncbi:MAG TPA: DUF2723 domain-containing protein [Kofleriaceae bacterium]|nr:DUF2723 domain-containing protein [Kofleriaceae bacterium]
MDSIRAWGPRAVALIGFASYALVAPAGPYWLGSGELIAAGVRLGSPPAPGFPLHCMLVKLASLVPIGELAFRVNLLGAACAALAMLWTARLVEGAAGSAARGEQASLPAVVGGLAAAVLLGVTLAFARQATIADVIAPTAALLAATALLFDRVARGGDARVGLLLAVVAGLGLAAHPSYRLLVPAPLVALLWLRLHRGARWPLLAPLVALAIGAALHLYLPVRSASGEIAAVDRGHPRDARALADHVAGPALGERSAGEAMSADAGVVQHHARRFAGAMADQIGVLGLIAALAGAASLLLERRSRWLLLLLAVIAIGDAVHAVWVDPIDVADGQGGVPFAMAAAALAGLGVAWLGRFAGPAGPAAAAAAGAMLAVGPAMITLPAVSPAAAGQAPRRFAEAALDASPPRAAILTASESLSSLLLYLTAAEGARPDVAALDRSRATDDLERSQAIAGPIDPRRPQLGLRDGTRALMWELGDDAAPPITMRSVVGLVTASVASAAGGRDEWQAAGPDPAGLDPAAAATATAVAGTASGMAARSPAARAAGTRGPVVAATAPGGRGSAATAPGAQGSSATIPGGRGSAATTPSARGSAATASGARGSAATAPGFTTTANAATAPDALAATAAASADSVSADSAVSGSTTGSTASASAADSSAPASASTASDSTASASAADSSAPASTSTASSSAADSSVPGSASPAPDSVGSATGRAQRPSLDSRDIARAAFRVSSILSGPDGADANAVRTAAVSLTGLGRLAAARSELGLALEVLDRAVGLRAAEGEGWLVRGAVLARLGRVEEAARSVERSLAVEPDLVVALLAAARYRLALGDVELALAHAERAIRLDPDAPAAWTIAALADARVGRIARARERLTRALTLDPDQAEARRALRSLAR